MALLVCLLSVPLLAQIHKQRGIQWPLTRLFLRHHTQGTALFHFINNPQCMALQYCKSFQGLCSHQGQIRGCRPRIARTAHTASLQYPGFYTMLQSIAPRLQNGAT